MTSAPPSYFPAALSDERGRLRRQVLWLIGTRLLVATLLLGGTLLLAVDDESGYTAFTPRALITLIAATFAASAVFAWWANTDRYLPTNLVAQIGWDVALTTGLVYLTGGAGSVFSTLYGISVLSSAIIVAPRVGLLTAAASLALYLSVSFLIHAGQLGVPPDQTSRLYRLSTTELGAALLSNLFGMTLVAVLSANLAARLRRAGEGLKLAQARTTMLSLLNDDIVRSIASGLLTVDLKGRIRTVNPAGASILKTDPDDAAGRRVSEYLEVDLEERGRGEATANRADGSEFPVGFTTSPLVAADGEVSGTLVVFQDLTQLRDLEAKAEQSERLAALGRLAAGLAHEIRNPLGSIAGSVELVKDSGELSDEDKHLLSIVGREVDRLNELVTTMLELGRPSEPTPATVDVRQLVLEVARVARMSPLAQEVEIDLDLPEDGVELLADPDQLKQVVWNLLRNALQVSPPGAQVCLAVHADPNHVNIDVIDQGRGVSSVDRDRIFELFHTSRSGGVGLGLALVQHIIDRHGGTVTVLSQTEIGATFRVALPKNSPLTGRVSSVPSLPLH